MIEWLKGMPEWLGLVGWVLAFLGFLLNRQALASLRVTNRVNGKKNTVTNNVTQNVGTDQKSAVSDTLGTWGSWTSIVGLALALWPLLKGWLLSAS